MKIKIIVGMEGPATSRKRGEIHEVDDAEAVRLLAAGFAEPVVDADSQPAPLENASLAQPQTAILPAGKRGRGPQDQGSLDA
jgi:hypothetical protein